MAKNEKQTEQKAVWKKAIVPYFELKIGGECEGYFLGIKKVGERINEKTGEVQDRKMCFLQKDKDDSDTKYQVNATKGLEVAMGQTDVQIGDYIRICRLEKKDIGGGQTVNQYDILIRA